MTPCGMVMGTLLWICPSGSATLYVTCGCLFTLYPKKNNSPAVHFKISITVRSNRTLLSITNTVHKNCKSEISTRVSLYHAKLNSKGLPTLLCTYHMTETTKAKYAQAMPDWMLTRAARICWTAMQQSPSRGCTHKLLSPVCGSILGWAVKGCLILPS